jgi:hypothetical protein
VHIFDIAQSLALFVGVCLAMAVVLSLAMAGLARMERATVPVRRTVPRPVRSVRSVREDTSPLRADRVSSPGSVTYGPRR